MGVDPRRSCGGASCGAEDEEVVYITLVDWMAILFSTMSVEAIKRQVAFPVSKPEVGPQREG